MLETRVHAIDRHTRRLSINGNNTTLGFDKLFIGTGSHPRHLTVPGAKLDGVCYLRSIRDALDLKERLKTRPRLWSSAAVSSGLEVAASASKLGKKVTLIESASRLLERAVSRLSRNSCSTCIRAMASISGSMNRLLRLAARTERHRL
jgi:NADPH-dependent 2,4-dienoyl-CoA reductase/sulfur reductase-like enzyme